MSNSKDSGDNVILSIRADNVRCRIWRDGVEITDQVVVQGRTLVVARGDVSGQFNGRIELEKCS